MGRNKRKTKKPGCPLINEVKTSEDAVDISSRLSFPVIKKSGIESDDDAEDEDTVEFDFRPRKMFLSNTCLICSRISRPEFLCEICKTVSYCTENHLRDDAASHRSLCRVLSELRQETKDQSTATSPEEYRTSRVGLIKSTEVALKRYLELWEKEMILYPRACHKCRSNNLGDLNCCPDCKVVFWCHEHNDDNHSKWCLQYEIFQKLLLAQTTHGNVEPHVPNVYFTAPQMSLNNFDTIMSRINNNSGYFRDMDFYNYITLSHLASIPLTTLYAFQELRNTDWRDVENFTVHLIGAEFQYEGINLRVWEKLFLHFLPNLINLRLVITGPELFLPQVPRELLSKVKLCNRCKFGGKKISVSFVPRTLYHDFCSSSDYQKPDFACLFNPGLYRKTGFNGQDTWPKTISELCRSRVPILVTAYTEHEIPMDVDSIGSVSDIEIVLAPRKNPFASLKPDRNFVSDESVPLIYKNYYLSVVKAAVNVQ